MDDIMDHGLKTASVIKIGSVYVSNITGAAAFPTEDNKTQPWDNSSLHQNSKNSSSLATTAPGWINNQSSPPLVTKATQSHQSTQERILYITGGIDDDYYEDDTRATALTVPPQIPAIPCLYDRCKHLEQPCEELQRIANGKCLCPGLNGPKVLPEVPRLGQIVPGERYVTVNWCSPMSTVHGYRVLYGPPDGLLEIGPVLNASHRSYSIEGLHPDSGYRVCVVAFNSVGQSLIVEDDQEVEPKTPGPCRLIHTTSTKESYIYVAVALVAMVGLIGLAVLGLWLCRRRKTSLDGEWEAMGLPNLSYRERSVEQL
ncbi:LRRN4 C-terminal-like protein [Pelodytes ibericus]